jgi:excisionase family DNA binding protein
MPESVQSVALLTVNDLAQKLRLSRSQIYTLVARGVLPPLKLGRSSRWLESAIDEWLARGARPVRPCHLGFARRSRRRNTGGNNRA